MLRVSAALLAAVLVVPVASAQRVDLRGMGPFDQIAYAFGFEAAQGLKSDSASFKYFDYATFEDGFNDGLAGDSSKIGYLFGFEIGNRIGRDTLTNVDTRLFLAAFREGLSTDRSQLGDEELQQISSVVQDSLRQRQLRARAASGDAEAIQDIITMEANAAAAAAFLRLVKQSRDVIETPTGLLYSVDARGFGATARPDDVVVVTYRGTLADGTLFDEGVEATFALTAVAPGFREGVAGMRVGGKRTMYVPPALGYGSQGTPAGPIPPNAALVFEIELLDILDD